jgi:hypothetical protein
MKRILLALGLLFLYSCGIYNLEMELKNPLGNLNIFDGLADKEADEAKEYQCQMEIDGANWTDALDVCSALASNDVNNALYASALHGKNGGDLFAIIDAAEDTDNVIKGYVNSIEGTDTAGITELTSAVTLVTAVIANVGSVEEYEFQLSIIYFTRACARIREAANRVNSNASGDIVAADINAMTSAELDDAYSDIRDSQTHLGNAGVTGTVLDDVADAMSSLGDQATWDALNEAQRRAVVITLLGL